MADTIIRADCLASLRSSDAAAGFDAARVLWILRGKLSFQWSIPVGNQPGTGNHCHFETSLLGCHYIVNPEISSHTGTAPASWRASEA